MKKSKIVFTGHFFEYFIMCLGLGVLTVLSLGILLPYFMYWNVKYFFTRMEIHQDS